MAKLDDKIKALEDQLKQAKALRAKAEAKARAEEAAKRRAADTHRKVLVGALVLDQAERDATVRSWLQQVLDAGLTRASDREAFGLAPLPEAAPAAQVPNEAPATPQDVRSMIFERVPPDWLILALPDGRYAALWAQGLEGPHGAGVPHGDYSGCYAVGDLAEVRAAISSDIANPGPEA